MSKILKDSTYNQLKAKSDAWDRVMQALQTEDEATEMTIEEQADLILVALDNAPDEQDGSVLEALQAQLDAANEQNTVLQTQLEEANNTIQSLNNDLDNLPAEEPAKISSKQEGGVKEMSLSEFADKNAGNTFAILDKLKEEGLL